MSNHTDAAAKLEAKLGQLLDDEISTNQTFYVAEITGEHDKYGLDREFVTSKRSPYSLVPGDFDEGTVYELKDDREDFRGYFTAEYPDDEPLGDKVPFRVSLVDEGDNVDQDAILDIVGGEADGRMAAVRNRVRTLVDDATDPEALEAMATMLEDADDTRDPGEVATVDLTAVPTDVHQNAQLFGRCFSAAFERQTGQTAGVHLQAAALDAAVLAERKKRDAAKQGGD